LSSSTGPTTATGSSSTSTGHFVGGGGFFGATIGAYFDGGQTLVSQLAGQSDATTVESAPMAKSVALLQQFMASGFQTVEGAGSMALQSATAAQHNQSLLAAAMH